MTLVAFFDDSGSDDKSKDFVLGGIVIEHRGWQLLCTEWMRVLAAYPPIPCHKQADNHQGLEKFKGIDVSLRREKSCALAAVISKYMLFGSYVYMPHDVYLRVAGDFVEKDMRLHAYQLMLPELCNLAMNQARNLKLPGPIQFILDEQSGQEGRAASVYADMKRANKESPLAEYFGGFGFDDDCKVPPLQAADLLVWYIRRGITHPEEEHFPHMLFSATKKVWGGEFTPSNILKYGIKHRAHSLMAAVFGISRVLYPGDDGYDEQKELDDKMNAQINETLDYVARMRAARDRGTA